MNDDKLICPYCGEVMCRGSIEMDDGHWEKAWLCGCVAADENIRGALNADCHLGG